MKTYGLIGEVLKHSFSPQIHAQFDIEDYNLYELSQEEAEDFMREASFEGMNVTIPYKEIAMKHCVHLDEASKMIGALNTLVKMPEGLYGYNTDIFGFTAMCRYSGIDFTGKKVVILGSGGTSKTACYASKLLGASKTSVVSRRAARYEIRYDHNVAFTTYEDLKTLGEAQILVNTTPVGMFPNNGDCPIDLNLLPNLTGVVDVIYNPLKTRLVQEAEERGIPGVNGLFMLAAQAFEAERFFLKEWTDFQAPTEEEFERIEKVYDCLLQKKKNLVLTGMPGSGKSTIGHLLSEKLGMPFADTDKEFEKTFGISPEKYIIQYGEGQFRDKEAQIAFQLSKLNGYIIATGGGIVLRESNIKTLNQNGDIIYLHRRLKNLATEGRPLSQGSERLKGLYYKRLPIYLKNAKKVVTVSENTEETLENLEKALAGEDNNIKILVINGPNLNMLGIREPDIYGKETYSDLMDFIRKKASEMKAEVDFFQSNHEGDLVDAIQESYGIYDGIVINPGAYTHTSVALLDALKAVAVPAVEVHISDVDEREEFRRISYIRRAVIGCITGKGFEGYKEAISMLIRYCGLNGII